MGRVREATTPFAVAAEVLDMGERVAVLFRNAVRDEAMHFTVAELLTLRGVNQNDGIWSRQVKAQANG